jgi:predicted exporter
LSEISGSMESDLKSSVVTTVLVIAGLFWLAHRSWRPLGWLIFALLLTLALTLALGGLVFGTLNVVSLGFAAVLLGLTVDYRPRELSGVRRRAGQVAGGNPARGRPGHRLLRRDHCGHLLLLGFAGLPGLAQLGVLTALGLLVGAGVMLFVFLPLVARQRPATARPPVATKAKRLPVGLFPTVAVVVAVAAVLLGPGTPRITASADPLRPRSSAAYDAMDELKLRLGRTNEPVWALFSGRDPLTIAHQLESAQATLTAARGPARSTSFDLPGGFWPRPDYAATNLPLARSLAARAELRTQAEAAGFTADSLALAHGIFTAWNQTDANAASPWPTNATARGWSRSSPPAMATAVGWRSA